MMIPKGIGQLSTGLPTDFELAYDGVLMDFAFQKPGTVDGFHVPLDLSIASEM
jgi:hypothetical protein